DEEHRFARGARLALEHAARRRDQRLAVLCTQPERHQPEAGLVAAAIVLLHEAAPDQRGEQPMGARFRKPERAAELADADWGRRSVKVEQHVDGLLDARERLHGDPPGWEDRMFRISESSSFIRNYRSSRARTPVYVSNSTRLAIGPSSHDPN